MICGQMEHRITGSIFARETTEVWTGLHKRGQPVYQTRRDICIWIRGALHLSCADFGEAYTGRYDWKDYTAVFEMTPLTGENNMVNVRVQGAIRSYAVALLADSKIALLKNENGYRVLTDTAFDWKAGRDYEVSVCAQEPDCMQRSKKCRLDVDKPNSCRQILLYWNMRIRIITYLQGAVGVSVRNGSHAKYSSIRMRCNS